ncbi:DUF2628 domain-containing protein [Propylenella binzhouense]|uniref:DUF2628 domain-containing protein n=1 Tax=Propylenella binzhouense TaxID=2555902 RepID=A0A964T2Z6_9HYPH|nr:DUF2628 domain-containing protein [Propylenella binzhouense]MYZ47506.1 DUF2628 domain-containing protein [Propylenella binzhouense]
MATYYTVHAPPDGEIERARFVKEGFSWPAFFFPVIWLLWHGLWVAFVLYLVYAAALFALARTSPEAPVGAIALIGAILFALEANNIRRAALARRGWRELGEAWGRGLDEAEHRFFRRGAAGESASAAPRPERSRRPWPAFRPERREEDEVVGLFPRAEA